jgi:hypothetical protein
MHAAATETEELQTLVMPTVAGDRCANCGAHLAADQRYCLECGERRGDARLPIAPRAAASRAVPAEPAPRRAGSLAGTTLVAGVGTLVLAIGVGVLIGRTGQHNVAAKTPPVQVVTVAGSATPGSTPAAPGSTTPAATPGTTKPNAKAGKGTASNAAVKAVPKSGGKVQKTKGTVVKIGSKGHGPGYQNGKFTGNFFGG